MSLIQKLYIKLLKDFTINKIKYIFFIFLFSPLLIFILIIRPIILFRFGNLGVQRIGSISLAEQYLLNKINNKKK